MATCAQDECALERVKESLCRMLRLLPRGLTLGPSLAEDGQTGLWCVGQDLQTGTNLGLEDPEEEEEVEYVYTILLRCTAIKHDGNLNWRSRVSDGRREQRCKRSYRTFNQNILDEV